MIEGKNGQNLNEIISAIQTKTHRNCYLSASISLSNYHTLLSKVNYSECPVELCKIRITQLSQIQISSWKNSSYTTIGLIVVNLSEVYCIN